MMRISQIGIDLIKQFEGFRSKAYICPAGVLTIGYAGAAQEFKRWNRGGGRVLAGLVRRREAEAKLFNA